MKDVMVSRKYRRGDELIVILVRSCPAHPIKKHPCGKDARPRKAGVTKREKRLRARREDYTKSGMASKLGANGQPMYHRPGSNNK